MGSLHFPTSEFDSKVGNLVRAYGNIHNDSNRIKNIVFHCMYSQVRFVAVVYIVVFVIFVMGHALPLYTDTSASETSTVLCISYLIFYDHTHTHTCIYIYIYITIEAQHVLKSSSRQWLLAVYPTRLCLGSWYFEGATQLGRCSSVETGT